MSKSSRKVRTCLSEDESMSDSIRPFTHMFLCDVVGVVLRPRGSGDRHSGWPVGRQCGWKYKEPVLKGIQHVQP